MRKHTATLAICTLFFLGACGSLPTNQGIDSESTYLADRDAIVQIEEEFLSNLESLVKLDEMRSYERLVSRILNSEPLRLGPLGTALLDRYEGSLTGQLALARFYEYLEQETDTTHTNWVKRLKAHMSYERDGTRDKPIRALNINDAKSFLQIDGLEPIGTVYGRTDDYPLLVEIVARGSDGRSSITVFEILASRLLIEGYCGDSEQDCFPIVLSHLLGQADNAAVVSLAVLTVQEAIGKPVNERMQALDRAISMLQPNLDPNNVLTSHSYASFLVQRANLAQEEQYRARLLNDARSKYRAAISAGYMDSMLALGRLYIGGAFGDTERESGIDLYERAIDLGNPDAATTLGWIYADGFANIPQDLERSFELLKLGKDMGSVEHGLDYVRFLIRDESPQELSREDMKWLRRQANDDNPGAMLILGQVYARGLSVQEKPSVAMYWYRKIPHISPYNAELVNQVAWILATSEIRKLRDAPFALEIMNKMMIGNRNARRSPMYLDTWAAAYAAMGQWREAMSLQVEAVERAMQDENALQHLEEMREHLEAFRREEALFEDVP